MSVSATLSPLSFHFSKKTDLRHSILWPKERSAHSVQLQQAARLRLSVDSALQLHQSRSAPNICSGGNSCGSSPTPTKATVTVDTSKARSNADVVRSCIKDLGWKEVSYRNPLNSLVCAYMWYSFLWPKERSAHAVQIQEAVHCRHFKGSIDYRRHKILHQGTRLERGEI